MRKDRLYLLSFLAVALIFLVVSSIAIEYFVKHSADRLLNTQLESSKREAKEFAMFIGEQIKSGTEKELAVSALQKKYFERQFGYGVHQYVRLVGQNYMPS